MKNRKGIKNDEETNDVQKNFFLKLKVIGMIAISEKIVFSILGGLVMILDRSGVSELWLLIILEIGLLHKLRKLA